MLIKERYNTQDIIICPKTIKFVNHKGSQTKGLNISSYDIRRQLKKIGFISPYNDENAQDYYSVHLEKYSIPYMNYIYYFLFFKLLRIPTFEEFLDEYIKIYMEEMPDGTYRIKQYFDPESSCFSKNHIIGRIFRSYNSFHRELDFLFQLSKYDGISIWYDFQDDLNGIDFTVNYNGNIIGIASYAGTSRSKEWKVKKNEYRHDYSHIQMINAVAKFKGNNSNCNSYNGVYLYSYDFVKQIYDKIREITVCSY